MTTIIKAIPIFDCEIVHWYLVSSDGFTDFPQTPAIPLIGLTEIVFDTIKELHWPDAPVHTVSAKVRIRRKFFLLHFELQS